MNTQCLSILSIFRKVLGCCVHGAVCGGLVLSLYFLSHLVKISEALRQNVPETRANWRFTSASAARKNAEARLSKPEAAPTEEDRRL